MKPIRVSAFQYGGTQEVDKTIAFVLAERTEKRMDKAIVMCSAQ